ncbi:hypothetical protein C5167_026961 [Papaver somniferum]|nr:hypothetical protein C5167_026961 [Papaver somniferum]
MVKGKDPHECRRACRMVLSLQRKRCLKVRLRFFSKSFHMGYGACGKVPSQPGTLSEGRAIVVKQLSVTSHQGKSQFIAEISTISSVQHRNLVKLYGCCIEGAHRLLVYEYLEHRSLDQALFDLAYLHEESRPRIVHRDVKASNIISDFRLAKLYDDKKTHISTRVAGTIGYLGPEYAMLGHLTEKADVYGFGVVALEIVSGRPNADTTLDQDKMYLLGWEKGKQVNKAKKWRFSSAVCDGARDRVDFCVPVTTMQGNFHEGIPCKYVPVYVDQFRRGSKS